MKEIARKIEKRGLSVDTSWTPTEETTPAMQALWKILTKVRNEGEDSGDPRRERIKR